MQREVQSFQAATAAQRAEADRITAKIGRVAADPKPAKTQKHYVAAKLEALRALHKKTAEEADFFDRQALAAQRLISPAGALADASPQRAPSPVDSLDAVMAHSSTEGTSVAGSLPPSGS